MHPKEYHPHQDCKQITYRPLYRTTHVQNGSVQAHSSI